MTKYMDIGIQKIKAKINLLSRWHMMYKSLNKFKDREVSFCIMKLENKV